jgi:hypothetical protein
LILNNSRPLKKRRKGQKHEVLHTEVGRLIFRSDIQLLQLASSLLQRIEHKWYAVLEYYCVVKSVPSSLQAKRAEEVALKYSIT